MGPLDRRRLCVQHRGQGHWGLCAPALGEGMLSSGYGCCGAWGVRQGQTGLCCAILFVNTFPSKLTYHLSFSKMTYMLKYRCYQRIRELNGWNFSMASGNGVLMIYWRGGGRLKTHTEKLVIFICIVISLAFKRPVFFKPVMLNEHCGFSRVRSKASVQFVPWWSWVQCSQVKLGQMDFN